MDELEPQCVRMATGFGGGVGSAYQELCGALSGSVLVIGGLYGRENPDQDDELALSLVRSYRSRFLAALGDTQCERLRERVQAPGGLGSCAALVERAATVLLELLAEVDYGRS